MRLGVYHTAHTAPWTHLHDRGHLPRPAVGDPWQRHELVVHRRRERGVSIRRQASRGDVGPAPAGVLSSVKKRINRVLSHGLLLPAPFAAESWLDSFL
jgi:hypothetical protein